MHAIVVHVKIDPGRIDEAQRMLREEVVPSVQQAPGLVNAYSCPRISPTATR